MTTDTITKIVEVAISLAQTQLGPNDARAALLRMAQNTVQAYEKHTGEPLDLSLITSEAPL